ncbi:MAG: hypothetical protein HZB98_14640, partial [Bacteroidia bacterium]|nr:hypothetical protein [Bacteroidia bacterium]
TTGVDAVSRSEFWDMLGKLRKFNITILVSTPYMDEAMRCDRVALIQNGNLLAIDTPGEVRNGYSRKLFSVRSAEKYKLIIALRSLNETLSSFPFGESVHVTFKNNLIPENIDSLLREQGITDAIISETEAGIEDRFLELMQTAGPSFAKTTEGKAARQ